MPEPTTKYAKNGDVHIAYQVVGEGEHNLVLVPGWVSHVELGWEEPTLARFLGRLASFARLIVFDKRGTGLSDRVPHAQLPPLEERMDDLRAVMDAAGSERAALFGCSEGGNLSTLFAATYPQRTSALVLFGAFAKRIRSPDYPWAPTAEQRRQLCEHVEREWGRPGAEPIRRATPDDLRSLPFAAGSMGPKVDAACHFAEATGKLAAIGALADLGKIIAGKAGTTVHPSNKKEKARGKGQKEKGQGQKRKKGKKVRR